MKKPLLRSLILSYVFVLLPVLILCAALWANIRIALESSIVDLQMNKTTHYKMAVESELKEFNLIINQLFSENHKNKFSSKDQFTYTEVDQLINLRTRFSSSVVTLNSLKDILLYYKNSNYAVTSRVVLPLETAYSLTTSPSLYWGDFDALSVNLNNFLGRRIYLDGDQLYLSCSIAHGSGVLFSLDQAYFLQLYELSDSAEEHIVIADRNGNIILQHGEEFPVNLSSIEEGTVPSSSEDWLVSSLKIDGWNYYVISAISRSHMDNILIERIWWLFIALPLCLLLCIWMVYYSSKKHYNPIAKLLQIANDHGLPSNKSEHEFDQLHILLRQELDNHQRLEQSQNKERQQMEDSSLFHSLTSMNATEAVSHRFTQANMAFPQAYWCFIELNLLDFSETDDTSLFSIARYLISQNLTQNFAVIDLFVHHRLLFLIGMNGDINAKGSLLKSDLQRDINFLREEYSAEFNCIVTEILSWQEDFSQVTTTLMEQLHKMQGMASNNLSSVHVFQSFDEDTQEALYKLKKMEQDILRNHYDDLTYDLKELAGFSLIRSNNSQQEKPQASNQIIEQVVRLVEVNYFDQNLNISYLAQQVGRHPNVLSKAFRQEKEIGLLDYIHTVRIEAAKKLLLENPQMTIQRVSELCGYVNSDSFQRTFKRVTGTTPGKFRDQGVQ